MLTDYFYRQGQSDARDLRARANGMDGTAVIREEHKIPKFKNIDYTDYPIGTPVKSNGQVWKLLQPYNASIHTELPENARDRWALCHTKDAKRAKAWVAPLGVSGLYLKDECYVDEDGKIWRCKVKQTNFSAKEWPQGWEEVIL